MWRFIYYLHHEFTNHCGCFQIYLHIRSIKIIQGLKLSSFKYVFNYLFYILLDAWLYRSLSLTLSFSVSLPFPLSLSLWMSLPVSFSVCLPVYTPHTLSFPSTMCVWMYNMCDLCGGSHGHAAMLAWGCQCM